VYGLHSYVKFPCHIFSDKPTKIERQFEKVAPQTDLQPEISPESVDVDISNQKKSEANKKL
jgi:hypothetical protein